MTFPTSVIALFCEDIREEKSGAITLLGIMPDNVNVPALPANNPPNVLPGIAKLCIYIRLHFDPRVDMGQIETKLIFPDGTERVVEAMDASTIEKARAQTTTNGGPVAGIFSRVEMSPFLVPSLGRMRVEMKIAGQMFACGSLNFVQLETAEAKA